MIAAADSDREKKDLEERKQRQLTYISQTEGLIAGEKARLESAIDNYNNALKEFEAIQKQRDDIFAEPGKTPPQPSGAPPTETADADGSQGKRLKALDDSYKVQAALAQQAGEDIYRIEQEWQQKRIALLQDFIQEDVASRKEGVSVAEALSTSLESSLSEGYGSILSQLEMSQDILDDLSTKSLSLNIDTSIRFLSESGLTVEDALKKIRDEAKSTADQQLNNIQELISEQDALNIKTADGNIAEEARAAVLSRLQTITGELADAEKTRSEALAIEGEASARLLASDLSRISQTRERTEEAVNREIELKKELGLLGSNEKEVERNTVTAKRSALLETQNRLISQYNDLMASGTDEDMARADAVKNELAEIGDEFKKLDDIGGNIFDTIADKIKKFGDKFVGYFESVAGIVTGLIGNAAEKQAQEFNKKLESIERERNAVLNEIDNEMYTLKEEHRIENEEKELAHQQRLYEEQQTRYERDITELQAAFNAESNIEKLRELEKQIEEQKKKKREAQEQKKKDEEDKKRAEEQLAAENDILTRVKRLVGVCRKNGRNRKRRRNCRGKRGH